MARFEPHPQRRPAIIAGASSGIGAATATELAAHGFPVALGARRVDKCEELAARIRARFLAADWSDPKRPPFHGFLLSGHGLYTWGRDLAEARRQIEIHEFLFEVVARTRSFPGGPVATTLTDQPQSGQPQSGQGATGPPAPSIVRQQQTSQRQQQ